MKYTIMDCSCATDGRTGRPNDFKHCGLSYGYIRANMFFFFRFYRVYRLSTGDEMKFKRGGV